MRPVTRDEALARAETDPVEAALRELDPDSDLLAPGIFKGTLWLQAARWEIDRLLRSEH